MRDNARVFVTVVSWNRPHYLKRTLESLFEQLVGVEAYVMVIDNGSDLATREVIAAESRLSARMFLWQNVGINAALEAGLPNNLSERSDYVLFSDADMQYNVPVAELLSVFEFNSKIGAVSLQHSPEHPIRDSFRFQDRDWLLKSSERGCALLMRSERVQELRPFPVHKLIDFDWWVVRDAPASLEQRDEFVAVQAGAATHLAWRAGESTWQQAEIPEVWNQ